MNATMFQDIGHPCVSQDTAPSVRVTPRQFVDVSCSVLK